MVTYRQFKIMFGNIQRLLHKKATVGGNSQLMVEEFLIGHMLSLFIKSRYTETIPKTIEVNISKHYFAFLNEILSNLHI